MLFGFYIDYEISTKKHLSPPFKDNRKHIVTKFYVP
jgi:hypothetical protein